VTKIIIAPSKEEQAKDKQFHKTLDLLDEEVGGPSQRDKDQFFGGPNDGLICQHNPNGPRNSADPEGLYADYFIKDKVYLPEFGCRMPGYHMYSCVRQVSPEGSYTINFPKTFPCGGLRGANFRKSYFYVGFISPALLAADGINPSDFREILSAG